MASNENTVGPSRARVLCERCRGEIARVDASTQTEETGVDAFSPTRSSSSTTYHSLGGVERGIRHLRVHDGAAAGPSSRPDNVRPPPPRSSSSSEDDSDETTYHSLGGVERGIRHLRVHDGAAAGPSSRPDNVPPPPPTALSSSDEDTPPIRERSPSPRLSPPRRRPGTRLRRSVSLPGRMAAPQFDEREAIATLEQYRTCAATEERIIHHPRGGFTCINHPDIKKVSRSKVMDHIKTVDDEEHWVCPCCRSNYNQLPRLKNHLRDGCAASTLMLREYVCKIAFRKRSEAAIKHLLERLYREGQLP